MSRAEEIKTERRRRDSAGLAGRPRRLHVDESKLDRAKYAYRFVNDKGSRVQDLYNQDWNVANEEMGGENARIVGEDAHGKPQKAVLMRKKIEHYNDDHAAQQRRIDDLETTLRTRSDPSGGDVEGAYVPDGKSAPTTIRRG